VRGDRLYPLIKIFTLFIVAGMMAYLDNFSTQAWVYLGLHGIYGYSWLVKDGSISSFSG
jgi:hypothetical protein